MASPTSALSHLPWRRLLPLAILLAYVSYLGLTVWFDTWDHTSPDRTMFPGHDLAALALVVAVAIIPGWRLSQRLVACLSSMTLLGGASYIFIYFLDPSRRPPCGQPGWLCDYGLFVRVLPLAFLAYIVAGVLLLLVARGTIHLAKYAVRRLTTRPQRSPLA